MDFKSGPSLSASVPRSFFLAVPLIYQHAHERYNHMQTKLSGRNNGCGNDRPGRSLPAPSCTYTTQRLAPPDSQTTLALDSRVERTCAYVYARGLPPAEWIPYHILSYRRSRHPFATSLVSAPNLEIPTPISSPHHASRINDQPLRLLDRHAYPADDSILTWHTELVVARHECMGTNT
jgi:hypothetical protein